jgi:hypothetical protein
VQRYKRVASDDYTVTPGGERAPFTLQQDELEVADRPSGRPGLGMQFAMSSPGAPPLNVADDDSLAINASEGEPKEFYALPGRVKAANDELLKVGSPVVLFPAGNALTVAGKELAMVQPNLRDADEPGARQFAALGTDICRDMAKFVMGGITHAHLGDGGARSMVPIEVSDPTTVSGTHHLAEGLGEGTVPTGQGKALLAERGGGATPGKSYGEALLSGSVGAQTARLRINERAKAAIGQGYVTQSIAAALSDGGTKAEHSVAAFAGAEREFVWGYHYGAVIADSGDGKDQIILENYARKHDLVEGQKRLIRELKERFAAELRDATITGERPYDQIGQILKHLGDDAGDNMTAYTRMYTEQVGALATRWYFRMVGEGARQSFHEQMAGSGYFANPLTLSLEYLLFNTPWSLPFAPKVTTLTGAQPTQVRDRAVEVVGDLRRGRRLTTVRVTGYSSGTWSPWESKGNGGLRANAVAVALRRELTARNVATIAVEAADGGITTKFGATPKNNQVEMTAAG